MEVGAIQVPGEPGRAPRRSSTGSSRRSSPALVLGDDTAVAAALRRRRPTGTGPAAVDEHDVAVMIPTSGTTGRSKLVMQTHLAYVMAGEGFPWWMGLTADDRLMTSLPLFHINAPAYSTLGSIAARARPGAAAVVLGEHVPRRRPPVRRDRVQRHRRHARDPRCASRARADDADNPLRLCYTGPSPTASASRRSRRASASRSSAATRCRRRPTGLIWRHGTRPFGTLGSPRQHPTLGHVNDARVVAADDGERPVGRSARSASSSCATRRSCAATTRCPTRPRR